MEIRDIEGENRSVDAGGLLQEDSEEVLNKRLFARLDEAVEKEKLYARHDLRREMLCAVIGVDRNRIATVIRTQSGTANLSDYINRKRIRYAVELMRQNKNWTIDAICDTCGMNGTSFKRYFKNIYGMPPSEYRIILDQQAQPDLE